MPFAKAQGKRLRLGEGGGDRPAERLFSTAPHSSVQCATVDRACPGCKVCSSQKSSCWRQRQPFRGQSGVRHVTYL